MRLAFLGTPDFAVPTLRALAAAHDVVLVVAQPDKPAGRGQELRSPPVVSVARELGLPVAQPKAVRSGSFPARFVSLGLDAAVVIAYGRLLTPEVLGAPRFGCINVHASLLPRWRGAAPIQAAVLAGDEVTGVCTQRMEEGLDTGPIYAERRLTLDPRETAGTLHDRLAPLAAEVALATLSKLGTVEPTPQQGEVSWAEKLDKSSGRLDLSEPAVALDRRARAMSPWPGGWLPYKGGALKVLDTRVVDGSGAPGTVLSTRPLVVAAGVGALELVTVQAPGKRPTSGADLANGAHLAAGAPLDPA